MSDVAGRLGRLEASDRVAQSDALVQSGERAHPQPPPQGRLAEQQQAKRGGAVHPGVAEAADALEAVGAEQVRLVDDQNDLLAALGGLGGEESLGWRDERGVVEARGAAEAADDRRVDASEADSRRAEVDDRVPGRVEA